MLNGRCSSILILLDMAWKLYYHLLVCQVCLVLGTNVGHSLPHGSLLVALMSYKQQPHKIKCTLIRKSFKKSLISFRYQQTRMSPTRVFWNSGDGGQKDLKDQKDMTFQFINNNSDVYLIGTSQLSGFLGKFGNIRMNISIAKGASILDCLAECNRGFQDMYHKVRFIKD